MKRWLFNINKFTVIYNQLIKNHTNSFFPVDINYGNNRVFYIKLATAELNLNLEMAKEKAQYTMDYSQSGDIRSPEVKINKAFQGILAEYAVHKFINEVLSVPYSNIRRYDIERTDFQYRANEEFDIKIFQNNSWLDCEIRSSISSGYPVYTTFNNMDIIGPYYNAYKRGFEQIADFYIRPFYIMNNKNFNIKSSSLYDALLNDEGKLYILTGATKQDFTKYSYIQSMNQGETEYRAIKIREVGGIEGFYNKFKNL